jgi:hypothetical protein
MEAANRHAAAGNPGTSKNDSLLPAWACTTCVTHPTGRVGGGWIPQARRLETWSSSEELVNRDQIPAQGSPVGSIHTIQAVQEGRLLHRSPIPFHPTTER